MPRKSSSKPFKGKKPSQRGGSKDSDPIRLQRLLASAGFGSRRQCEELIEAGRVAVDGEVVTKLGTTVKPELNKVRVDGVPLKKQKLVYFALNKPIGVVTTNRDPQGRPRVIDLVPREERVFPVGRLDRNSEGLILLTNDGELAQKLTHPKFGVRKVYRVTVAGKVDHETMKQMRQGIYIAEGLVRVDGAKLLKSRSRSTEMEIVLREGKNREIRRILARLGHKVQHLRRIAVGPLRLGDLPAGAYRVLDHREIDKLWSATEVAPEEDAATKRGGKRFASKKRSTKASGTKANRVSKSTRRPVKKSTRSASEQPAATVVPVSRDRNSSATIGSVIGGDAPPETERPRRAKKTGSKRIAKKRSTRKSAKPNVSKSRSSGSDRSAEGRKNASSRRTAKPTSGGDSRQRGSKKKRRRE